MARKKKSILSFFEPDVEDCDVGKEHVVKKPLYDCEGVPTGKTGDDTKVCSVKIDKPDHSTISDAPIEVLRSQNEALHKEIEALEKTLSEVQNERESLKHEVANLRLQIMKTQLRDGANLNNPAADNCERYRTTGLPARRVKRIPSKSILFKGQKRKPL